MIFQNIYWIGIRDSVRKEVTNCDTCQHTKPSNIYNGKLLVKEPEKIPWNKLSVDLILPYLIKINKQKENLNIKAVAIIDPITG